MKTDIGRPLPLGRTKRVERRIFRATKGRGQPGNGPTHLRRRPLVLP